jgi:hypothetical protein
MPPEPKRISYGKRNIIYLFVKPLKASRQIWNVKCNY